MALCTSSLQPRGDFRTPVAALCTAGGGKAKGPGPAPGWPAVLALGVEGPRAGPGAWVCVWQSGNPRALASKGAQRNVASPPECTQYCTAQIPAHIP